MGIQLSVLSQYGSRCDIERFGRVLTAIFVLTPYLSLVALVTNAPPIGTSIEHIICPIVRAVFPDLGELDLVRTGAPEGKTLLV